MAVQSPQSPSVGCTITLIWDSSRICTFAQMKSVKYDHFFFKCAGVKQCVLTPACCFAQCSRWCTVTWCEDHNHSHSHIMSQTPSGVTCYGMWYNTLSMSFHLHDPDIQFSCCQKNTDKSLLPKMSCFSLNSSGHCTVEIFSIHALSWWSH